MAVLYERTKALNPVVSSYCPGCMHGLITKIVAEVLDENNLLDDTIGVMPIGCGAMSKKLFDCDIVCALHGRAPAVATGIIRCEPDKTVFTYQGDGDIAAIGLSEIVCAANRGENVVSLFVNNSTYGMTGGQMAPTTMIGQKTTTSQQGRAIEEHGYPIKMCEIISTLDAPVFVARYSMDSPSNVLQAKKAIDKAFKIQRDKGGFTFIELLSNCPTNWGMTPLKSIEYMREHTMKTFPLGIYKDITGGDGVGK